MTVTVGEDLTPEQVEHIRQRYGNIMLPSNRYMTMSETTADIPPAELYTPERGYGYVFVSDCPEVIKGVE